MNLSQRLRALFLCLVAILIGSSAYVVYRNTLTGYPVGASYFWFTFFAFLSALCLPVLSRPFRLQLPGVSWWQSLKKVSPVFYLLNGLLYTLNFVCILYNLHSKERAVVVTLLVINQGKPIISTLLGVRFLRDTCKSWPAFLVGMVVTIAGAIVYKWPSADEVVADEVSVTFAGVNLVILLATLALVFDVVQGVIDAYYRRKVGIPQADASANLFAAATLLGFLWMVIEAYPALPALPTAKELAPLAYLGLMPTAIGAVMKNGVRDQLGVPTVDVIGNMRPVFAIIVGLIPLSWFWSDNPSLTIEHAAGILMTVAGAAIVALFAKGEAAVQKIS